MTHHRLGASIGLLASIVLLGTACSVGTGASTPVSSGGDPALPAASQDCYQIGVEASQAPKAIADLRKDATDILVGVFQGYGEARWNTPDGKRPTPKEVQETTARLNRPMSIDFKEEVRGAETASEHAIARGGSLGCDSVTYSDDVPLVVGQSYLFFMLPVIDSKEQLSGDLLVIEAWPIAKGDVVETAQDGPMPLADVKTAIEQGPKPTTAPSPGEPEPTTPG